MDDHLYVVTYDIADQKRWRAVFALMRGYGEWLQLSVFQCRLSQMRHAEMVAALDHVIRDDADHVVVLDLGRAERVQPRVVSLGKRSFESVKREVTIV
jgi:CRISPR-associated protein Cas2